MNNLEVVGLGALNADNICKVKRILDDGEAAAEEANTFPGGSAANTIYGLAKLGLKTGFIGAVGDDAAGSLILDDFNSVGVDTSQISVKNGQASGSTICLSANDGKRSIYVNPGANSLLQGNDINLDYINNASLVHISSFAKPGQLELVKEVIAGIKPVVKISFSPGELYASMGLEALSTVLKKTHLLFANRSEIETLSGKDIMTGAEMCIEKGCHTVIVTMGKGEIIGNDGQKTAICYIRDADSEYVIEPSSNDDINIVDSTGAGDAFAAGFLYGWLKGKKTRECALLGEIVAGFSMEKLGARQGLPTPARLEERYRRIC